MSRTTNGHGPALRRSLGDYELLSEAGSGGMGVVYRALQRSLGRLVALKVIREDIASETAYRERFMREARLVASIDHPHVVSIFDVGEQDHSLFLAMQWVEGQDLTRLLGTSGRLAPDRSIGIGIQIAGALDAMHGMAGLIHRDVKPANILVRELGGKDHAYLTDFGVARPSHSVDPLTHTESLVGTSGYLAPEQIIGGESGPRSDLYALGCVLFELLTGHAPFLADNEMALRWVHANAPRPLASASLLALGTRYDDFFEVALAIDPARRFASGRAFANALAAVHTMRGEDAAVAAGGIAEPPRDIRVDIPGAVAAGQPFMVPPVAPPGYPVAYGAPGPRHAERSAAVVITLILISLLVVVGIAVAVLVATGAFSGGGGSAHVITHPGT